MGIEYNITGAQFSGSFTISIEADTVNKITAGDISKSISDLSLASTYNLGL